MTGDQLVRLRSALRMSQATFGQRIGRSASQILDFESGYTRGAKPEPVPIPKVFALAARMVALDWIANLHELLREIENDG
jgi:transcriptional regulator with XRE-family HTH domain